MADQETSLNGFLQTQVIESNDLPLPKKKRNLPGNPDPDADVLALSPKTLMATNRFLCEICGKGFQRDQNLQLHRRGHNLPWKLKQRTGNEPIRKRVYVCPEKTCVHSHPSRALGDLTGIKKHFSRKHGEKKWKCEKCNKKYAVQSDWKAHSKTCGTREYRCDCGTLFSRRDSFITHRAFCDALAEETARITATNSHFMVSNPGPPPPVPTMTEHFSSFFMPISSSSSSTTTKEETLHYERTSLPPFWYEPMLTPSTNFSTLNPHNTPLIVPTSNPSSGTFSIPALYSTQQVQTPAVNNIMSATALLQKAAQVGVTSTITSNITHPFFLGTRFGLITKGNNNDVNIENGSVNSTKFSGSIFGTSNSTTTNVGSDEDEQSTMGMYDPASKRQKLLGNRLDCVGSGGQTRDFLGVSSNPTISCHPSSMNEWI